MTDVDIVGVMLLIICIMILAVGGYYLSPIITSDRRKNNSFPLGKASKSSIRARERKKRFWFKIGFLLGAGPEGLIPLYIWDEQRRMKEEEKKEEGRLVVFYPVVLHRRRRNKKHRTYRRLRKTPYIKV